MTRGLFAEIRSASHELREALSTLGPRRTAAIVGVRIADAWFDWRHDLDTARQVQLDELAIPSANKARGEKYQATGTPAFRSLLRQVNLPRDAGFLDYGSGKGRILLLAAEAGFRRVVGVEFSAELCATARSNVDRYRRRHPGLNPIEIVEADASSYEPPADAAVFFFFSPFDAVVLSDALERIADSLRRHPRPAWLVYNNPRHREIVDARREFVLEHSLMLGGHPWLVYTHAPPSR